MAKFVKGQSGNPHGAPKKEYSISQIIREMMDETPEIKKALGAQIFKMALGGDITAIRTIWNYMDGMPSQDITSGGEKIKGPTIFLPQKLKEE